MLSPLLPHRRARVQVARLCGRERIRPGDGVLEDLGGDVGERGGAWRLAVRLDWHRSETANPGRLDGGKHLPQEHHRLSISKRRGSRNLREA